MRSSVSTVLAMQSHGSIAAKGQATGYTGVMRIEDEDHLYLINITAASLRLARRLAIQSRSGLDEEAYSH